MAGVFSLGQDCGDDEVQIIWAKILAGEVSQPGRVSRKTLAIVKTLGKEDAHLFTKVCSYAWTVPKHSRLILLRDGAVTKGEENQPELIKPNEVQATPEDPERPQWNMDMIYEELAQLQYLGLISLTDFPLGTTATDRFLACYFGRAFVSIFKGSFDVVLGFANFTQAGSELFPFSSAVPDENYLQRTVEWYRSKQKMQFKEFKATHVEGDTWNLSPLDENAG